MAQFKDILEKGITFIPKGNPLSPHDIAYWETMINATFPEQYRDYLLHANGGEVRIAKEHKSTRDAYAFNIRWPEGLLGKTPSSILGNFFIIQEIEDNLNLYFTITFSYNYNAWKEVLPPDTFPIANTPGGNYILIGLKGENRGKIYYWMLEAANAMEEPDVAAYAYLGWVADSFVEFVLGLEYVDE
jgi:hypothetical protein